MRQLLALTRACILLGSLLLLAFVSVCYWGRFDWCMVATVFPPWCWAGAGVILTGLGWALGSHATPKKRRAENEEDEAPHLAGSGSWLGRRISLRSTRSTRFSAGLAVAWLVFLLAFADSPMSLVRFWMPEPAAGNIRVVTFNCMSDLDAIEEVIALEPDIVMFQESRGRAELAALGERMYGAGEHVCWGPDASIVARGEVTCVEVPARFQGNFVHARVEMGGTMFDVISLRLMPSVFRLDLWSPNCWRRFRRNREQRRRQLERIAAYLKTIPTDRVLLFGGDFNAPPGDAVFRLLRPRLIDAFTVAGRGWGGTITNDWPAIRIDQLWTSGSIEAVLVRSRNSRFSDHRIVIGDFRAGDAR